MGQTQDRPNNRQKDQQTHSKIGRRHQENSTNIAIVRTAMYGDDVSIIATASSLTQAQKVLQNEVSAVDNWSKS